MPIGTWVLDEACRQLVEWSSQFPSIGHHPSRPPLGIAVNVSGRQLRRAEFVSVVKVALERNGLAPHQLCLEITETALIEETAEARETLEAIAALGVHIALDDFGTGYSSLAHLRQFPVDVLKIDRSFVDRLETNDRERQIVAAVTAMAHVLKMIVIAEGIETVGQLTQLTELGCDHAQGYLLARPMRPEALERVATSPRVGAHSIVWCRLINRCPCSARPRWRLRPAVPPRARASMRGSTMS